MSFGVRRRARRADQFVQIENTFLRDETLTIEARGVGAYLLTHAEGFRLSSTFLGKATGCGRDKLRRILAELEREGYLVREQARDGGRFAEDEFSMSDEKAQVAPETENPAPVNQGLETTPHKKTNSENTSLKEDHQDSSPSADGGATPKPSKAQALNEAIDAEFPDWWSLYPRKLAKGQAEKAYRAARKAGATGPELRDGLLAAIAAWKASGTETKYQPYPATWLNGKRWLDDPAAVGAASPARRSHAGPGVVHTAEERAQQQQSFEAMPEATPITSEELEALFRDQ